MDPNKKFALTIQRLRLYGDEKLSMREVANDAGISLRYYIDLEKGIKSPTLKVINGIAAVHGLRGSQLLELSENEE